jgi:serine/threonine-protein kinase
MTTREIKLPGGSWLFDTDAPVGRPGGFGTVYRGTDIEGRPIAVKRLHLTANKAAHRELRIAVELQARKLPHVVPILDSGQDAESDEYFVIMALAEESLEDFCARNRQLSEPDALVIIQELVRALLETNDLVHRDLKPANILKHEGKWKIADFGIARFVEEATSVETLKDCLSPQYAAPEQWKLETATKSTDVYSLGCISYRLLSGRLPFPGPAPSDYRLQHLTLDPQPIHQISPIIASLITQMMRKVQATRPSLERINRVLVIIPDQVQMPAVQRLSAADAKVAQAESEYQARLAAEEHIKKERIQLAGQAVGILRSTIRQLVEQIKNHSSSSKIEESHSGQAEGIVKIACGTATLQAHYPSRNAAYPIDAFKYSKWDVITGGLIKVSMHRPHTFERSASLWYTNLGGNTPYRWYEVTHSIGGGLLCKRRKRQRLPEITWHLFACSSKACLS